MKKIKEATTFKIIKIVLKTILFIVLSGFIISVLLQRFSGNKVSIFKYRMFVVISGSMKPDYKIGDVLISKEVKPETLKIGDDICYLGERGDVYGKIVTHRLIDIQKNAGGKYIFTTRGIANKVEDPNIREEQLYGKIVYKSILISFIYKTMRTPIGMIFLFIMLMVIIGGEIITSLLEKEEQKRNKKEI